jgi:succinyl-CoA synthetase alpha subunit
MSIMIDEKSKVLIQGITGHQGSFHALECKRFGTNIVSGVSPGKGGREVEGIPVFDSVKAAVKETGADSSGIFVPAPFVLDSAIEAMEAGITTLVIITEHVPVHDAMKIVSLASKIGVRIIGPNCPGIASPGKAKLGIIPNHIMKKGDVGVVSRSGTLTYEIVDSLTKAGMGQSSCIGIGGDRVSGTDFVDVLELFKKDKQTKRVVLIGEIGGSAEEKAAEYISVGFDKPVIAYIAGMSAPKGKRMGHAGAIISRGMGTAESKVKALERAGVSVAKTVAEIPSIVKKA